MIDEINRTSYVYNPNIGDYSDQYMMNREGYEGLTKQQAFDKDLAFYKSETARIRAEKIKQARSLQADYYSETDKKIIKYGELKEAHNPATATNVGGELSTAYSLSKQTVDSLEDNEFKETVKRSGTNVSKIYGDGIVEDSENLNVKVKTINETVDTSMTEMTASAFSYGENFMINLIAGINAQFSAFVDRVNSIKLKMSELEFYGNTGIEFDSTKICTRYCSINCVWI